MYTFKYKRHKSLFSVKLKEVVGHSYLPEQNKMVVYFKTGALKEIEKWSDCAISLGVDWVQYVKDKAEKDAGVPIRVNPH